MYDIVRIQQIQYISEVNLCKKFTPFIHILDRNQKKV
jgi:hypothetical protein